MSEIKKLEPNGEKIAVIKDPETGNFIAVGIVDQPTVRRMSDTQVVYLDADMAVPFCLTANDESVFAPAESGELPVPELADEDPHQGMAHSLDQVFAQLGQRVDPTKVDGLSISTLHPQNP